jgi:hypothetical protein
MRSGERKKGRCLPWSKEEEGTYIFWMKQVPVIYMYITQQSLFEYMNIISRFNQILYNQREIICLEINR